MSRTFSERPLRRVEVDPGNPPETGVWPADIPAIRQVLSEGLDLGAATVLVGENGTGKSTLVEAVAMAFGLNAEGGTPNSRNRTYPGESGLDEHLRCVRGAGASRWGFFLRAETMHSFFTDQARAPGPCDPNYHHLSHGEAFRALLGSGRFDGPGLYVLDEPESALSFGAQLGLLGQLIELIRDERAQVLLSTHSPVLACLPGARLLELGEWGLRETTWGDLELVEHYRRFLDAPERHLRHLS